MPDLTLPESLHFQPESIDDALDRYEGFGKNIFQILKEMLPEAHHNLKFFRPTKYQTDDVWAICSWRHEPFIIQLDPDCEVIVLSNGDLQIEIGTWENDPESAALTFICDNFK